MPFANRNSNEFHNLCNRLRNTRERAISGQRARSAVTRYAEEDYQQMFASFLSQTNANLQNLSHESKNTTLNYSSNEKTAGEQPSDSMRGRPQTPQFNSFNR